MKQNAMKAYRWGRVAVQNDVNGLILSEDEGRPKMIWFHVV